METRPTTIVVTNSIQTPKAFTALFILSVALTSIIITNLPYSLHLFKEEDSFGLTLHY